MTAAFESRFAERVLAEVFWGADLGSAMLAARRAFLEDRNPLGLAYSLYGRSGIRLGSPPPRDTQSQGDRP